MADKPEAPENDAIEVEFTSAEPDAEKPAPATSGGPGWIGLISVGIVAALAGGAIGVVSGGTGGRYAQASEVAVDISKLEESDRGIETEISALKDDLLDVQARLTTVLETSEERAAQSTEELVSLQNEVSALKAGYMSLLGIEPVDNTDAAETPETPVDEVAPTEDASTPQDAAAEPDGLPSPGITLAALASRLEAMETIDAKGRASPAELARSVAALQERTSALEEVDTSIQEAMAARNALIEQLQDDVKSLEEAQAVLTSDFQTTRETIGDGEIVNEETLTNLSTEIEGLRTLVNERLSALDGAKLSKDEEKLIRRADRVLALSTLETAIRSGESFSSELEALAVQLPANGRVSALRRISEAGAPTSDQLHDELQGLQTEIAKVGMPEKPRGQWAWLDDVLGSVVTVREEGSVDGETASMRVQTALNQLSAGDLPGAIAELKTVDGEQGELLKDWLNKAERRVRADSLLERLRNDVISLEDAQ